MSTYNLRRFSRPDTLKAIGHEHLIAFLRPYSEFLAKRGFALSPPGDTDGLDYKGLVRIFMTPDTGIPTPKELSEALYFIHEMSTTEGMDELLEEAERHNIPLNGNPDPTPADIAIQVWLQDRKLLERKHAEQHLDSPRTFEYYQTDAYPIPAFILPSKHTISALEKDLDDWFETKKRGRGCSVFVYPREDEIWFLVRHGEPYKREGSIEDGQSSSVFYRPEKYDVLVYEPALGELRMNAKSKGEKKLYQQKFGLHLFGNENFFPGTNKYTLEPLKRDGAASLYCNDVEGIEEIKLKEVQIFWGGTEKEIEIRKANDVFSALAARERSLPVKATIRQASFQVKFTDSKTPRTITIHPSNIAQYTRDDDSTIIEDWLVKRGFIATENREDHYDHREYDAIPETTAPSPMAGA